MTDKKTKTKKELLAEIEDLHQRLAEAEETPKVIRSGEVDTFAALETGGEQLRTRPYREEHFRKIFENVATGIAITDLEGQFIQCNPAYTSIVGYTEEELRSIVFSTLLHPADREENLVQMRRLMAGEVPFFKIENRYVHKNGKPVWVQKFVSVLRDDAGVPACLIALVTDITERKQINEALRRSLANAVEKQRTLEALMEYVPEGITIADASDLKILYVSRHGQELLGGPHQGKTVGEVVEQWQVFEADGVTPMPEGELPLVRAIRTGEIVRDKEIVQVSIEGRRLFLLCNASPIRDADGSIVAGIVSWRDISEHKRIERELERYREHLEELVKKRTAELTKANRDLKMICECNQALVRSSDEQALLNEICKIIVTVGGYRLAWVGYAEHDELKNVRPVAYAGFEEGYLEKTDITWADDDRGRGPSGTAIRTGQPAACRNILKDPAFAPWRDDAIRRGYASSIALPLTTGGRTIGMLAIYATEPDRFDAEEQRMLTQLADDLMFGILAIRAHDERRRAEAQLGTERQRLYDVLETLPAYVVLLAPDYHVPFANRFFRERFGESHGKRCFEYLFNRTEPCEICETYRVLKTNAPHRWEWTGPDGRNYDIYDFPFRDTDGSPLILEMGIDITERRQAERELNRLNEELEQRVIERTQKLEEANKELEAFSYSVSHDLRAPLRAIDGFSKILLEEHKDNLDDKGREYLTIVRNSTQHMGRLIDDLLAFSRLGRQQMRFSHFDMETLAKTVFEELKLGVPERSIEIDVKPLPVGYGDPALIRPVFSNLLSNAIKFTRGRETPFIEVGGQEEKTEGVYYVRDNGAGFDMKYAHKLFRVFQRLHSMDEFEGTGVGLAIVQRIIHRHGGRVWAEGEPNKGAAFYFSLPKEIIKMQDE
ncbi:MAG: PAS domain S-box protein [Nitrospirota bacterium]